MELEKMKQKDVTYCEWQKVPNPKLNKTGKTGNKISHSVPCTKSFKTFISLLINDINVMWEHLHRAHMQ